MVRKRTRKYDSDENDSDSDVDFDFEHQSRPAPKKYSLRERKKTPLVTDTFDYYGLDDEEGGARKLSSDDEDFEVEPDTNGVRSFFEPEPDAEPQNSEGLIDFEDIIRADIVVNKNKIDYDNLIQKTEIKLTQPKRRGRKPKNWPNDVKKEEPESTDVSQSPSQQLDILEKVEKQEDDDKKENSTSEDAKVTLESETGLEGKESLPNGDVLNNKENGCLNKEQDKSPVIENMSTETVLVHPSQNYIPADEKTVEDEEKIVEEDEDDDVIVLGELKQDVIVLDD